MTRAASQVVAALTAAVLSGCAANMTLTRPVDPSAVAARVTPHAPIQAVVRVDDFALGEIKTNFSADDMNQFRRDTPVIIGNNIFSMLAGGQQIHTVKRTSAGAKADFIVTGTYDHTSYYGTHGTHLIPVVGTLGAPINEAKVKEVLHVKVLDGSTGREIFRGSVSNEKDERTSVYQTAQGSWLEPHLIGQAAQAAYAAIQGAASTSSQRARSTVREIAPTLPATPSMGARTPQPGSALIEGINARVARVQFFVDDSLDSDTTPDIGSVCSNAQTGSAFESSSTKFIWFCVFLVPEGEFAQGSASFSMALKRAEDDSLVTWLPVVSLHPKRKWPYGMLFQGYGAKKAGEISVGAYRVDIYVDNELVGSGGFEIL